MKEKILERLLRLCDLDEESLAAADAAAERSIELIQAFCNIEEMPAELLGAGASLAELLLERSMNAAGGKAKSIKEGDISVSFAEMPGAELTEDELVARFRLELERFRRLPG